MLTRSQVGVRRAARQARAVALLLTITMLAVLTSLATTAVVLSVNNTQNAGRDNQAATAFNTSEGGIAAALTYLQTVGTGKLTCMETTPFSATVAPAGACLTSTNPWSNSATPQTVTLKNPDQVYKVYISAVVPFNPPNVKIGTYRIHAEGISGKSGVNGGADRLLIQDVAITPIQFPIGVFAHSFVSAGSPSIHQESIFTDDCLTGRNKVSFATVNDLYYGIPNGVHSTKYIETAVNGSCTANGGNIHPPNCVTAYPGDQDSQGGSLVGTTCNNNGTPGNTSAFTASDLAKYNTNTNGLTQQQYAALKQIAITQGSYSDGTNQSCSTALGNLDSTVNPSGVLYCDNSQSLGISGSISGYTNTNCGTNNIVIVMQGSGASLHINGNTDFVGNIFIPQGHYQGNGKANITGTLFAGTVDKLNGTQDIGLQSCFLNNFPAGLTTVLPIEGTFAEVEDQ